MTKEQIEYYYLQGYTCITKINGKICGLKRFIYTTGLVVGLDPIGYQGRYCYHTLAEATEALLIWDGEGHPSGNWIKYKGDVEISNPKYDDFRS